MGPTVQSSWVHLHCKLPCWVQRERVLQLLLSCICETNVHKNSVHKIACSLTCKYEKTFPCFKLCTDFLVEFSYTYVLQVSKHAIFYSNYYVAVYTAVLTIILDQKFHLCRNYLLYIRTVLIFRMHMYSPQIKFSTCIQNDIICSYLRST